MTRVPGLAEAPRAGRRLCREGEGSHLQRPGQLARPGERVPVQPEGPAALAFHGGQMRLVVESGTFDVMVGSGSEPLAAVTLEVAVAEA